MLFTHLHLFCGVYTIRDNINDQLSPKYSIYLITSKWPKEHGTVLCDLKNDPMLLEWCEAYIQSNNIEETTQGAEMICGMFLSNIGTW